MRNLRFLILTLALVLALPALTSAQMSDATPGGMDAYRNVFIAYAIAWIVLGGWLVSVGRRLTAVSRRLDG